MSFKFSECYASFLNLDHREDRLHHMEWQLKKAGISAVRTRGMYPNEYTGDESKVLVQRNRTPGSIGTMIMQMKMMLDALKEKRSALIFEDDVIFASDIQERFAHIEQFLNTKDNWSVVWLGGTIHIPEPAWRTGNNPDLLGFNLGKDAEPTEDLRMIKCYSAFSTFSYAVRYEKIEEVLRLLDEVMHLSMGIDFSFIYIGEKIDSYMYLPGCCKQVDGISDIGNGQMTFFSGFEKLGGHWFQEKLTDFDPQTIKW